MSNGDDSRDPHQRGSTDRSLRVEREKTDAELSTRSEAIRDVAIDVVARARDKADSVLTEARELEDRKPPTTSPEQVTEDRAREDAVLDRERTGADALARDERERRRLALASLLVFERERTNLQLETERIRADRALTAREDFMAMVSHDLRNLLGGIALSAELLQEIGTAKSLDKVNLYASSIQRFAARMNRLVGDLLDLASIEAGKLSVMRVRHNISALMRDAHDAFGRAAGAQGVELYCECAPDLGAVELDPERILQVLSNLVGNALKFTPKGGRIVIRVERRATDFCFAVADTGEGIPAAQLARVFERYFQASTHDRRGLGLGLFIAKSIVTQHGGEIWAESELGHGSTFYFTVPHDVDTPT